MELQGTRVFLVEDEGLVAMSVEDMLADLGCTLAAQASSVTEALEKAHAGGFEVALLDVSLHGKKVFPVAEFLTDQGIPFAFASGYGRAGLPEAFRTRPVVPKPFQIEELSAALTTALLGIKGGSSTSAELHNQ
ncbi:response regulator [Mesorhizobium sp. B2-4-8]|uniref:response regulator n=1 Tax=Mesorhizobium sp. B2-4-8 TaxID=2589941 RepID=UPI001129C2FA|nr:response regulator [Mesorhizobium sp. B2-4-8]TPL35598.1 response regulator [Mesorhizobium sp. B2-4-8]